MTYHVTYKSGTVEQLEWDGVTYFEIGDEWIEIFRPVEAEEESDKLIAIVKVEEIASFREGGSK